MKLIELFRRLPGQQERAGVGHAVTGAEGTRAPELRRYVKQAPTIAACAVMVSAIAAFAYLLSPAQLPAASTPVQLLAPGMLPKAPPFLLKNVPPDQAVEINRQIPFSGEPNPAARPFAIRGDDLEYIRALECLTSTIYYEAAHESLDGQRAVAQVVLNRVRHPAFPRSVCAVTFQGSTRQTGCQFTFTCDGALRRLPHPALWSRARAVAAAALQGEVFAPVGNATHYHANYVVPYWASAQSKNAVIGTHIFYRWPGWWGQPAAFRRQHAGQEPDPAYLRYAALGGRGRLPQQDLPVGVDPRVELISIIHLLATDEDPDRKLSPYERDVRKHFADHLDHEAVSTYRELQVQNPSFGPEAALLLMMHHSVPPWLKLRGTVSGSLLTLAGGAAAYESFITALRAFMTDADFAKFYDEQEPHYVELQEQARESTLRLLATVERHSDGAMPKFRLLLSPLLKDLKSSGCEPLTPTKLEQWILLAAPDPREKTFSDHAMLAKHLVGIAQASARPTTARLRTCSQLVPFQVAKKSGLPRKPRLPQDRAESLVTFAAADLP